MPEDPTVILKFRKANPIEPDKTWEDPALCQSPSSFAEWLTQVLFIDASDFGKIAGVTRSASPPTDPSTIWAKTSLPYGVGVYSGGEWTVAYKHPQRTPFLWDSTAAPIPTYISVIDPSAQAAMGLLTPTGTAWKWVIFYPPTYS